MRVACQDDVFIGLSRLLAANNPVTGMVYPDGRAITQGNDAVGRMASVTYTNWNGTVVSVPYVTVPSTGGYDADDHVTSETMGNGVVMTAGYDTRERIGSLSYKGSSVLWGKTYGWTASSNLQTVTDSLTGVQRRFGYTDNLNRLTSAQDYTGSSLTVGGLNQTYSYDSFGNIKTNGNFTASYTTGNRMNGGSYDAAGNVTTDGISPMVWDAESKLASVGSTKYVYDAAGNRVEKQGSAVTDTVYFGGKPVARLSGTAWTDLVYGPNGLLAALAGLNSKGKPMGVW